MPKQIATSAASPSSDAASIEQQSYDIPYYDAQADQDRTATHRQTVKSDVIQTVHAMIHERLFGDRPWLVDREAAWAVNRKLKGLGLNEQVILGELYSLRETPLGGELNINLMKVFMGMWEPYEVPMIFADHGLLSEDEILDVEECLYEESPETALLPLVRRAFFQHFQAGARLN
jgi:hypothetical protein